MTLAELKPEQSRSASHTWDRRDAVLCGLLAFITLVLYYRTVHFDFIGYDDQVYIYGNPHVENVTLQSFNWALTAIVSANWHPLTLLTELLIAKIFGIHAGAFHLTNAFLHCANAILIFVLLQYCTGRVWPAFFTALLWTVHPLRVESVAWVSELKDVLCGFFVLSCLLAYSWYSRQRHWQRYIVVLLLFTLAILSKPMAVTVPALLLLMNYWPLSTDRMQRSNWTRLILETLPLWAISIADSVLAMRTQAADTTSALLKFPVHIRIANAVVSTADYLRDLCFPRHLAIFYPHPSVIGQTIPIWSIALACLTIVAITAFVFLRRNRQPYLLAGWLWYLGMLVPVIGLVQVGLQSRADRYTYLPSIGIFVAVVWFVADAFRRSRLLQLGAAGLGSIVAITFAVGSVSTIGHWQDTNSVFEYARAVVPDNFVADSLHSAACAALGEVDEALRAGKLAISIAPNDVGTHVSYAAALTAAHRYVEAGDQLFIALNINKYDSLSWDALARVRNLQADEFAEKHLPDEKAFRQKALTDVQSAVKADPDNLVAKDHLAYQLALLGRIAEAIPIWRDVVDQLPSFGQAQGDFADALRMSGDLPGAVEHYNAALNSGEKRPAWETSVAYLVATNPHSTTADVEPMVVIAKDACDKTNNRDAAALDAYAACLARVGRFDDAIATAKQAVAQANADQKPGVALGIQKRLSHYLRFQPYVAGDDLPTSAPATTTPS